LPVEGDVRQSDSEANERLRRDAGTARDGSALSRAARARARRLRAERRGPQLAQNENLGRAEAEEGDLPTVLERAKDVRRTAVLVRHQTVVLRGAVAWEVRRLHRIQRRVNELTRLPWNKADLDFLDSVFVAVEGGASSAREPEDFAMLSAAALADLLLGRLDDGAVAGLADPALADQLHTLRTRLDEALRR
jgi:hypothetical protein